MHGIAASCGAADRSCMAQVRGWGVRLGRYGGPTAGGEVAAAPPDLLLGEEEDVRAARQSRVEGAQQPAEVALPPHDGHVPRPVADLGAHLPEALPLRGGHPGGVARLVGLFGRLVSEDVLLEPAADHALDVDRSHQLELDAV